MLVRRRAGRNKRCAIVVKTFTSARGTTCGYRATGSLRASERVGEVAGLDKQRESAPRASPAKRAPASERSKASPRERAQRSEPRERSEPTKRLARERVGESEGRSPSEYE